MRRYLLVLSLALCFVTASTTAISIDVLFAQDKKKADAEEKEKEEQSFDEFMLEMGKIRLKIKKDIKNKKTKALKENTKTLKEMAAKIIEKDTDKKRKKADDYKKWTKELKEQIDEFEKLVTVKKPGWDKVNDQFKEFDGTCDSCHEKYDPEDD